MFEQSKLPRVFGVPPGSDFPQALVKGLQKRLSGQPPDAMARVTVYVNTRRMQRRLKSIFETGPASFMPKVQLVTEIGRDRVDLGVPKPVSALRRRMELGQLVAKLIEQEPGFAPRNSVYDLADSLANLLDEMDGEGVSPDVLRTLDVSDQSGHWQRTLQFVQLIEPFFSGDLPGAEAHQRQVAERLSKDWSVSAPSDPIIVAGSTGSRGATSLLMQAVARLPQGAVVLPGFDFDMTPLAWGKLGQRLSGEDHPQFRFAHFADALDLDPLQIPSWTEDNAPNPALNKLVSLSLRPAPVTDQWLIEGKTLRDLDKATNDIELIEADSPRTEASAIALIMREAAETGARIALISPDRQLTRQVTAALDRWGIVPDDSAGRPLPLSAPGRLLRQIAHLFGRKLTGDALLALLKHPLIATGGDRGTHLLNTRELELWLRHEGPAFVTRETILAWGKGQKDAGSWVDWLTQAIDRLALNQVMSVTDHIQRHINITEQLCAWPAISGTGALWDEAAGLEAQRVVTAFEGEAPFGGSLSNGDYADLFDNVLDSGVVRDAVLAHPNIMIWGTLEARVQGAETVILAGLNEGSWPSSPRPDPWLNRALRNRAELLLPEREVGLSAHDYQLAICSPRVILTRSIRDAESQTVPARWLNRLCNLLDGLGDDGQAALAGMRQRGQRWLDWADQLDRPATRRDASPRPSPRPPVSSRPKQISITEVQRLVRDPYAVYARRVLGLKRLDSLRRSPDAPLRGTVFHRIFEQFVQQDLSGDLGADIALLGQITDDVLSDQAGWPAANRLWRARIDRLAEWFVTDEHQRRLVAVPTALEATGTLGLPDVDTVLTGKIDRIDRLETGALAIYDYKTGTVPSAPVQEFFDKQLLLSALLAERGKIDGLATRSVAQVGYIGLGSKLVFDPREVEPGEVAKTFSELLALLSAYRQDSRGYTARRAVDQTSFVGDYDHLARYGEWDESTEPQGQEVG